MAKEALIDLYTTYLVFGEIYYISDRRQSKTLMLLTNVYFVCFVALRPKSTAMVIAGRSVNLTTLFPGQA